MSIRNMTYSIKNPDRTPLYETGRRAGGDRRVELGHSTAPQFLEAVGTVLPMLPKILS
jgi:hypothetical protein